MPDRLPIVLAGLQRPNGEGVPQVVDANALGSGRTAETQLTSQSDEDDVNDRLVWRPA